MELDWSTFLLEIINFLVLVWILKRFLYQPVLDVIARRRSSIEEKLAKADAAQDEAAKLKAQYEGRLAEWEGERRKARDKLAQELDEERARQLEAMRSGVEQEREKILSANERQLAEQQRTIEYRALQQGAAFSSRLLEQAAGPELQARLLTLLLEELARLSDSQLADLKQQWGTPPDHIEVSSAFPLSDEQRQQLTDALHRSCGLDCPLRFSEDDSLLAGLLITVGAWILAANVRDELSGFAEFAHVPR